MSCEMAIIVNLDFTVLATIIHAVHAFDVSQRQSFKLWGIASHNYTSHCIHMWRNCWKMSYFH